MKTKKPTPRILHNDPVLRLQGSLFRALLACGAKR